MATQTAISLAVLQVNWDKRKQDYLENFVPIVAECIRLAKHDEIVIGELKKDLESLFGLRFPVAAITTLLRRLKKREYVSSENGFYKRRADKLSTLNFRSIQQNIVSMHDTLINSMMDYCKKEFDQHWSPDETQANLLAFLRENDLQIMSAMTTGTLIPDVIPTSKTAKYYVSKYINYLQGTRSGELDYLEKVVEGNMLANAIFLPDPMRASQKFHKTKLFFDTRFLIFALGYAGKPRQEPCTELLNMLYETGADLSCFRHTVEEITGILDACAHKIGSGQIADSYGPTIEYFINKQYSESDIQLLINNLPKNLATLRIQIDEKPLYDEHEYVIGEKEFGETLDKEIHYLNPQAKIRDIDSISAIMRFRRNGVCYILEECRALFVTTNTSLARASRNFFYKDSSEHVVAPCITDSALTTLLWLKKPLKLPDLPMKRIIADCYAAMQPDEHIIRAYLSKIDQLEQRGDISSDEVFMLRYSLEAKKALMDLTSGDENVFVNVTIMEVLELVKERLQAKAREEIQAKTEAKILEATEELGKTKSLLDTKINQLDQAEQKIQELTVSETTRDTNISLRAQKLASRIATSIEFIIIAILLVGVILTLPWQFPPFNESMLRYIFMIAFIFLTIFYILNLVFGTTAVSIKRTLETKLKKLIYNLINRYTN